MNKKFSTLMAGLLLAGGLFSTVNAQTAMFQADGDQYYYVRVNNQAPVTGGTAFLNVTDVDKDGIVDWAVTTQSEANQWTVKALKEKPNGEEIVIGYQLINRITGKPFSIKDGDVPYDTL